MQPANALPGNNGGQPAQVVIDPELLQQIQTKIGQGIDAAAPIAAQILKQEANLSINASATSVKVAIGMPSVNPAVDSSAASTKSSVATKIDTTVQEVLPAVKDTTNRSVASSVTVINSSFQ
jgi:hypothetical protein